jgi:hypothetical protein
MLWSKHISRQLFILASLLWIANAAFAQVAGPQQPTTDGRLGSRMITTGVPFLLISPDARSGAMGDAGVAISPDVNSIAWNAAKMAYLENPTAVSISFTPWLL